MFLLYTGAVAEYAVACFRNITITLGVLFCLKLVILAYVTFATIVIINCRLFSF